MKIRLCIIGFIFISFFFFSCTTETIDDQIGNSGSALKNASYLKLEENVSNAAEENTQINDSIQKNSVVKQAADQDGDPSNPRPPRK